MSAPDWLTRAVFYQIWLPSFHDGNGDGIGDLPGVTQKLDDLAELGITALLLHPCYLSPFRNGGFDVADHRAIAPRYGTLDDFASLVDAAHARDMRVCLDLIPGHTSDRHPLFQAAAQALPAGRADRRYLWSADPAPLQAAGLLVAPGLGEREGVFACERYVHQPALNYGFARPVPGQDSPDADGPAANWAALRETMQFWLGRGADGFRVLAPERLIRADPYFLETRRHWQHLTDWLRREYPAAVVISTWGVPELAADAGFDVDLLVNDAVAGHATLFPAGRPRGVPDFGRFCDGFAFQQARMAAGCRMALPTSGPELRRLADGRDETDLKLLFTFLLTWPVLPFLYYGDEIGMRHVDGLAGVEGAHAFVGSRTPMQWDHSPLAGFSANTDATPWLPLDPAPERPSVAAQRAARDSLWHHIERLLYLRATEPDLSPQAPVALIGDPGTGPLVFRRGQGVVVAVNPGRSPAQVPLPRLGDVTPVLSHNCQVSHGQRRWQLRLGGRAFGVFNVS